MGNNAGKEAPKGTETPNTGIPEIQQAEQKARQVAEAIKNDPTVQKVQEKGKEILEQAKENIDVQKVGDKAKEIAEKAKEGINLAEIEGKAKDTFKDVTQTLSNFSHDSTAFLKDAEKQSKV
jgi:hypothetical protein